MIRINYPETIRKVNAIHDLSDRLSRLSNDLNSMMNDTSVHWHGQAATAYLERCEQLRLAMVQTRNEMTAIAKTIQNVADAIKRTDEHLARLASQSGGGGGSR